MMNTAITKMFNIRYPIIQGGLQGLGTSPLVSAVSEAGGLGLITAGSYSSKEEMLDDISVARRLTSKPFGVNIAIGIRKPMDEFVEGAIEAHVPVVFTSGNNPEKYMDSLKGNEIKVVHVVPSVRFAKKAEAIGCDAVVVVGYECGGHPGREDVTSLTLIQKAVEELSIPVIAAGGFSTGKSALAAFALGAQGVQMGTRFLASKEVVLHESIKRRLIDLQETDTILVKKSIGKAMRVMKTERAVELVEKERAGATLEEIFPYISGESYQELLTTGNDHSGVISLGQTIGLINEIRSAKEIIQNIVEEYEQQLERLYQNHRGE
ncbi:nitronate monooxygenase family protein [Rossellomorea aquimaris]|uniref:NAD(P)H-dependent flavin oxidoreductase n=1 Tax=Rossellomorea aquimaris TaxID=189382 RepID=UPI0011E8D794|nr:nitronate monooxygenase family protein [Rossellomorea aquimaris]TYS89970.1 nitronate monooxygenase [Rossellomorea aquimaris]